MALDRKRLIDLSPRWVGAGGEDVFLADGSPAPERHGVGVSFECPCGCEHRCFVVFSNPLDGGTPYISSGQPTWARTGETFDTLTLTPSILRRRPCPNQWHGFITNGEVKTV